MGKLWNLASRKGIGVFDGENEKLANKFRLDAIITLIGTFEETS
jgi:hypothetical protein